MSKFAMIVKFPLKPGTRDEFVAAFQQGVDTAQGEAGTLIYILHTEADSDVAWVYELYEDEAAMKSHSSSDAFKELLPKLSAFFGGAPEIITLTPSIGKGL